MLHHRRHCVLYRTVELLMIVLYVIVVLWSRSLTGLSGCSSFERSAERAQSVSVPLGWAGLSVSCCPAHCYVLAPVDVDAPATQALLLLLLLEAT